MSRTIYWHDYETFGPRPSVDRPSQFAGVRTSEDLDVVGEPLMMYCQPVADLLPTIDACLMTGITPQFARQQGVPEPEFIGRIYQEFRQRDTCGAGYNSIRFDDEVTRYTLYRNFHDPYAREWQNGNSRWDIIDMVRLTYAIRPGVLAWPERDPGVPSFKLELLSQANGLEHDAAHDALSDVMATISLARRIKQSEPGLYDFCLKLRDKAHVASNIDLETHRPLLHISSKISARRGCATLVMPLVAHPVNANAVICVDLCADPAPLYDLSQVELRDQMFGASGEPGEGQQRVPLMVIHLNRCPVVLPTRMLDDANASRLQIDVSQAERAWQRLVGDADDLCGKASGAFAAEFADQQDAEAALYAGFLSPADRRMAQSVVNADCGQLSTGNFLFKDTRMNELLFRYQARHFPASLSPERYQLWISRVASRLGGTCSTDAPLVAFETDLEKRLAEEDLAEDKRSILLALQNWAEELRETFPGD